ncbi:MAG: hypothetical protein ACUVX1_17450 [Chloroflexota bacterium]
MTKLPFGGFVYLLVLVCLLLTGCGQQAGSPSAAQTQSTSPKSEASPQVATAASAIKTSTPQPNTPSPAIKPTSSQTQVGATTASKGRVTAREAWRLVEPEVQKWQKGAKIAIGGPSTASKDFDLFDGKASEWRFTCATPDEQQFWAFYVNTAGEQPKLRSGQASRPAVTAMTDPASWQIDSPRAYEIAMANGLKEWLAEHSSFSGKDATMELRGLKEIGSYWLIICHHDKKTIEFQISATDGKVHLANSH